MISLEAGTEFVGNFTLPVKSGDTPIVVQSAAAGQLPGDGARIAPAHAPQLARIWFLNANPALKTAAGAHHWQLRYLEFPATQDGYGDIIQIGDGSSAQNTSRGFRTTSCSATSTFTAIACSVRSAASRSTPRPW